MEPPEPVQLYIYQSNTYREDLSWSHFDDEPKGFRELANEGPTVLHIRFQVVVRSTGPEMATTPFTLTEIV